MLQSFKVLSDTTRQWRPWKQSKIIVLLGKKKIKKKKELISVIICFSTIVSFIILWYHNSFDSCTLTFQTFQKCRNEPSPASVVWPLVVLYGSVLTGFLCLKGLPEAPQTILAGSWLYCSSYWWMIKGLNPAWPLRLQSDPSMLYVNVYIQSNEADWVEN